jgi:hypothetical protein
MRHQGGRAHRRRELRFENDNDRISAMGERVTASEPK